MNTRDAFEAWCLAPRDSQFYITAFQAWQAATLAERERCAKICDAAMEDWYFSGLRCAAEIRKGKP